MAPRRPASVPDAESPLPRGAAGEVPLVGAGRLLRYFEEIDDEIEIANWINGAPMQLLIT
jgi:hypothetical protein